MAKILIVGSEEYEFPEEGTNASWGEEVTDWATAVSDALTSVVQPNDITKTTAVINNNQTIFANIAGFSFDTSEVISINADYIVRRTTDSSTLVENGLIQGNYTGSSWVISHTFEGDAQVEFDITAGGQIQYKSSNQAGASYVGEIIFRAKVFNDT